MEASALDYVTQSCTSLTESLARATLPSDRDSLISYHIKKLLNNVAPIEDFQRNLSWVNVSEPISLVQHCSNKIVVLDFWTYCCINCYHVLSDLAYLEKKYPVEKGVVVIGVHCPKFTNEKYTANILSAVQRYGIHHPVVNDAESAMWDALGIVCWPTLVILGPGNKPIFVLTGEGHREVLDMYIENLLKICTPRLSLTALPVSISQVIPAKEDSILSFPSKIAVNPYYKGRADEPFIAISDTGHNRVLLTDSTGLILKIIGGVQGFKDGKITEAQFREPQGLCWLSRGVVAVCDTGNHAVRALHLDDDTVETLAGNGTQAEHGDLGGSCLGLQKLSSPWDVVLYTTPDMDMSVRPLLPQPAADKLKDKGGDSAEKANKDEKKRVLLIACAGSHQIWALFLDTTIWWKYKKFIEGTCVCVAGSGAEAARNSSYPHTAAFAQPAGLALRNGTGPELFIADSESSSIRKMALTSGQVSTLCGGDRNPLNLFAYGDVDDVGTEAKLQHPLCVAFAENLKTLFIADTYNNKIKRVDLTTQKVSTITLISAETNEIVELNEPSGLSLSNDSKYLYVADTNNHKIRVLNTSSKFSVEDFRVRLAEPKFVEPDNMVLYQNDLFINRKCGNLIIYFNVNLDSDTIPVKFNPGAPQNWKANIRDEHNNDVTDTDFEFVNCRPKGTKLPGRIEIKLKHRTAKNHYRIYLTFECALCDVIMCFSHIFTIRSNILVRDSVKLVESYKITCKVNPKNRASQDQN